MFFMLTDIETYYESLESKRKELSEQAAKQYEKEGKLFSASLLNESNELDGAMNKQLLEERISQYSRYAEEEK